MAQIEYTIKVRRDTATNWTSSNTVLAEGEFGYESDTGRLKIGDGSTPWVSLVYGVVTEDMIGTPNGVVPLNGSGTIDPSYFSVTATTDSVGYQTSLKINNPTHVDTVQEVINHHWSTGVIEGCALTNNGDGTINLASGFAMIRGTASEHADLYSAAINAQNNITLTNDATNYIYLSYNAGSPTFLVTTDITTINGLDETLTYIVHRSGTTLNVINVVGQNVDIGRKLGDLFRGFSTFIHGAGGSLLSSPSTTTIAVSAGKFYFQLNEISHASFDTSIAGTANANIFKLWYRDGSGGFTSATNQKTITTTTYDSGTGTPSTLGNNKYGVTWFYIAHNEPSSLHAVMGQSEYATEAAAKVATPPSALPSLLSGMGSIVGSVVYLKGGVSFLDVLSVFTTPYTSSAATNHNGLAGLQGGQVDEYYHLTASEHDGTGSGDLVRQTAPTLKGNIGLDKASDFAVDNLGVKTYGWRDNVSPFVLKGSGPNNPSWALFRNGIYGYFFSASAMQEVWLSFHIDHDYAMGTVLFPHIHWSPNTTSTGTVRWGIEYSVAKGHQQVTGGDFPATTTVYVEQNIESNSRYRHFVTEVAIGDAIPATNVEPDTMILCRFFRDASHVNDTFPDAVMGIMGDLHYQVGTLFTLNKSPNFHS